MTLPRGGHMLSRSSSLAAHTINLFLTGQILRKSKKKQPKNEGAKLSVAGTSASRVRQPFIATYQAWLLLVLALLVFLLYSNTISGPFLFDDEESISANKLIRLQHLSIPGLWHILTESIGANNRPVANISFALDYFFHGLRVEGYHVVNILIHIATGILFYFFAKSTLLLDAKHSEKTPSPPLTLPRKLFSDATEGQASNDSSRQLPLDPSIVALTASAIWLVHPLQTQSVSYIVQRMNSLSALFFLLSCLLYVRGRICDIPASQRLFFVSALFSGLLALGSKQIAVTLPAILLLYEWYFFRDLDKGWARKTAISVAALCLLAPILFPAFDLHPINWLLSTYKDYDFTLSERILTEFRVVIFYLSLLLFPHPARLNLEHDFPLSHSLFSPFSTIICLATLISLLVAAVFLARKERLLSFGIFWFLGNLVVESSFIGLDIVFEHRTYLPSMFVILSAVFLLFRLVPSPRTRVLLLGCLLTLSSYWTFERNKIWADSIALWQDCVNKSPDKARPHSNLGRALGEKGEFDRGIFELNKSLQIKPDYAVAHNNLGTLLEKKEQFEEAASHFRKAIELVPNYAKGHYNLGVVLLRQQKVDGAISHLQKCLTLSPDAPNALNNLGVAFEWKGDFPEAQRKYREALAIAPGFADAQNNLNRLLKK